ncbi:acyltransferase [Marinobacter sp. DY40_1A1]|uniref:acyltransferase n=1 Tax=Marinobacter sp. DY40_1A1 TaxID=2583229 RepID=UPI001D1153CB|nr:acyltransferase [Marinobacter sp. DY40_1A1]
MSFSQAISLIPGKTGIYIRAAFYRLVCTDTSDEISVGFLTIFSHADTTIEKGVYIGPQCNIGKCTICADTLLGSAVHILSGKNQHNFDDITTSIQKQGGKFEKIRIGRDCWIGNNATVLADVSDQCVIAAGSVSAKSIPNKGDIVAGNPARVIKNRLAGSVDNEKLFT